MTYAEALSFWYSRVDFERKQARPSDLKLEHMHDLLHRLGDPQDRLHIVHIAGSKGKGSTAAMFAAVAHAAGLKTGLFTSPHLIDVSERIQIDGQPINRDDIASLLTEMRPHVEAMEASGYSPTFFEIATALGFLHFARKNVQLAVIEVGLGGRFDATNVCRPLLTAITSISLEHTAILGNTLGQIAFEKAGIIKPGCPVISGVTVPESAEVIRKIATERGAELIELGRDFDQSYVPGIVSPVGNITYPQVTIKFGRETWGHLKLNLLGSHQAGNAALVAVGSKLLSQCGVRISDRALRDGLGKVHWLARMQVFPGTPVVVLDCAHNPASAQTLVESLAESFAASNRTLVFACSSDKDVNGILTILVDCFSRFIFTRYHLNPRCLPPESVAAALRSIRPSINAAVIDDPVQALAVARNSGADLVVIAGSTYLAGELLPALER